MSGRNVVRLAVAALGATFLGAFGSIVLAAVFSPLFGYRALDVMSGSMTPTIRTGDLIVDRSISPLHMRVGDIVTFHDGTRGGELVTHRVRKVAILGKTVRVVTRGDANTTFERWSVPANGRVGRVVMHLPKVGFAVWWTQGRYGRLLLIVLPALLLGGMELRRIWRPVEATPGADVAIS